MRAGNCGPAGNASTNIAIKNITFRRVTGTVQSPGAISCRKGNPCTITYAARLRLPSAPLRLSNLPAGILRAGWRT